MLWITNLLKLNCSLVPLRLHVEEAGCTAAVWWSRGDPYYRLHVVGEEGCKAQGASLPVYSKKQKLEKAFTPWLLGKTYFPLLVPWKQHCQIPQKVRVQEANMFLNICLNILCRANSNRRQNGRGYPVYLFPSLSADPSQTFVLWIIDVTWFHRCDYPC